MKQYDSNNYSRYKKDLKSSQPLIKKFSDYTRDELIIKFMPLAENLARKFSTSQQASGVMTVVDMHDNKQKITIRKLSELLKVSSRTVHRHMCQDLKKEKELLNQQLC